MPRATAFAPSAETRSTQRFFAFSNPFIAQPQSGHDEQLTFIRHIHARDQLRGDI